MSPIATGLRSGFIAAAVADDVGGGDARPSLGRRRPPVPPCGAAWAGCAISALRPETAVPLPHNVWACGGALSPAERRAVARPLARPSVRPSVRLGAILLFAPLPSATSTARATEVCEQSSTLGPR